MDHGPGSLARLARAAVAAGGLLAAALGVDALGGGSEPGPGHLAVAGSGLLVVCLLLAPRTRRLPRGAALGLATLGQLALRVLLAAAWSGSAVHRPGAGTRGALAAMSCAGARLCAPAPSVVAAHAVASVLLVGALSALDAAGRRLVAVLAPLVRLDRAGAAPLDVRPPRRPAPRDLAPARRAAQGRSTPRRGPPAVVPAA